MPASDILNPSPTDPLNPDYGWTKKRPVTHVALKARSGPPYRRQTVDNDHQLVLNWGSSAFASEKAWADIARLKRYYEQYLEEGYFTIIDWESGNHRQHVGYFATPVEEIPVRNNCWAAQNVLFVEVPGAEMLEYPSDWTNDAVWQYCITDPVFSLIQVIPAPDSFANWTLVVDPLSESGQDLQSSINGAYVQTAYVGWGFQLWAPTGPTYGTGEVYLDGNLVGIASFYSAAPAASSVRVSFPNVPLGIHVVRLVCSGPGPVNVQWFPNHGVPT